MRSLPLAKVYQSLEPGPVVFLTTAIGGKANVMVNSWRRMVDLAPPLIAECGVNIECRLVDDTLGVRYTL